MKGKSIFLNYFISYLVVLGLAVLLSIVVYFYSFRVIKEQAAQVNQTVLETMRVDMDGRIGEVHKLISGILLDSNVQKTVKAKGAFSLSDRETLYNLYTSLLAKSASLNFLHDIFIFYNYTDTVLSLNGHMDNELFYELYYKQDEYSLKDLVELMQKTWTWNTSIIKNSKGVEEVLFLQTALPIGNTLPAATIAVSIEEGRFQTWMQNLKWDPSVDIFMINQNGEMIGGGKETAEKLAGHSYEEFLKESIIIAGELYMVDVTRSQETDWSYVVLTPMNKAKETASKILVVMLSGLIVCIAIGIIAAYYLTRFNYNPIKNIIELFEKRPLDSSMEGKRDIGNEYQWLSEQIKQFFMEHQKAQKLVYDKSKVLKDHILYRLVTRPYDPMRQGADILGEGASIEMGLPWNLVLLVMLTSKSKGKAELETGISKFILMNVFEELTSEHFKIEHVDLGDAVAFIINTPDKGNETQETIETIVYNMQKWLSEKFELTASVFAGEFKEGLDGIHDSYATARESWEYRSLLSEQTGGGVIWYRDIESQHAASYEYSTETENKIINAIKAGEHQTAMQWISSVLQENFKKKTLPLAMKSCLLFDLLGTVLKSAEAEAGSELILESLEEQFSTRLSYEEIEKNFDKLLGQVCKEIREKEQSSRADKQFGNKVMDYVKENYQNPDLNISITAMHYNITPAYLSSLFKEQTGYSLLEYINSVRIEKAKELLNEQSYSVAEIALMTGFRNSGALIRVFKKLTGITPGQMKRINEQE